MRKYPIIGVCGKARSGKDSVTRFLLAEGVARYRYAFADPVRAMLFAGLGIDAMDTYFQDHKEDIIPAFGKSLRELMQSLGTGWGRTLVSESLWITLAKTQLLRHGAGMLISDIRYENEAAFVRSFGGMIVHVQRDARGDIHPHCSEMGVKRNDADKLVFNNGTLEELQLNVQKVFNV